MYAYAGEGLDGGLDTDGDGIGAVVLGAGPSDTSTGYAFLVEGPVSGTLDLAEADCTVIGKVEGDWAGYAVAAAGDVTGDGADDWLVAARHDASRGNSAGAVYLVSGTKRGTWSLADVDAKLLGERSPDEAGWAVSSAGDVNGDGLDDVLMGAPRAEGGSYEGAAYLLLGPFSGTVDLGSADAIVRGEHAVDWLGNAVAPAGDVDDDGLADILIAARGESTTCVFRSPLTGEVPLSGAEGVLVGDDTDDDTGLVPGRSGRHGRGRDPGHSDRCSRRRCSWGPNPAMSRESPWPAWETSTRTASTTSSSERARPKAGQATEPPTCSTA
jgi:hypothetical protein